MGSNLFTDTYYTEASDGPLVNEWLFGGFSMFNKTAGGVHLFFFFKQNETYGTMQIQQRSGDVLWVHIHSQGLKRACEMSLCFLQDDTCKMNYY